MSKLYYYAPPALNTGVSGHNNSPSKRSNRCTIYIFDTKTKMYSLDHKLFSQLPVNIQSKMREQGTENGLSLRQDGRKTHWGTLTIAKNGSLNFEPITLHADNSATLMHSRNATARPVKHDPSYQIARLTKLNCPIL